MKIYTRGGDRGETSLFGGERISKSDPRIEAYGTVDELNAFVGAARAAWESSPIDAALHLVQQDLFEIGAALASPSSGDRFPGPDPARVTALEEEIDRMTSELPPLKNFVLPGGSAAAAMLHVARTVCRRAERMVVALGGPNEAVSRSVIYLNRLSDYLFVAARYANQAGGVTDIPWQR